MKKVTEEKHWEADDHTVSTYMQLEDFEPENYGKYGQEFLDLIGEKTE